MDRSPPLMFACVFLASCAAPASPPSLLPRAIETQSSAEKPPALPESPPVIEAALAARLAALETEARAGDADFTRAARSGAATLAAGTNAPVGSESWIASELVHSALQVARQRSTTALTEIDALAIAQNERASRDASVGGLREIQAAQAEAEAIVAAQTARLDALSR